MKTLKHFSIAALASCTALLGCSHRNEVKAEALPTPMAKAAVETPESGTSEILKHYIVKKGDCLWSISAKPIVFGDAFRWPLLYRQNRDEIENPDLIEPRQDLSYRAHYDSQTTAQAVKQAEEWPPYVPKHKVPSAQLKD
jgi:hypothetical protein